MVDRRLHIVLPFAVLGAAEDYGLTIAEGMAQRGWEVTLAHSRLVDPEIQPPVIAAPIDINSYRAISRWLIAERPSLLHVNQVFLPLLSVSRLVRIHPTIVTAHTPALPTRTSRRGQVLRLFAGRGVDHWIVLSERNRQVMANTNISPAAISAVYPGLPAERFDSLPDAAEVRTSLGLGGTSTVVGTVGRLAEQKRHDILIDAVAHASRHVPDLKLVIVGDGELSVETRRRAEQRFPGGVIFTGHREDVIRLVSAFDVFAMSSDFEGLPFALMEAMALGRAIVTTDVQGAGEAIRDGREGLVVPRRDADQLAAAIVALARNKALAEALGRAARERYLAEFTADRMIERTEAVYRKLLAARGRQLGL